MMIEIDIESARRTSRQRIGVMTRGCIKTGRPNIETNVSFNGTLLDQFCGKGAPANIPCAKHQDSGYAPRKFCPNGDTINGSRAPKIPPHAKQPCPKMIRL
jgi:hypothetical protein